MIIYILMLVTSLIFVYLYKKASKKSYKCLCFLLSVLPFILVSGIRYDVGTDYLFRYAPDYLNIVNNQNIANMEIGFKTIMYLCTLISKDYVLLFIVTSIIINIFVFYTIFKESKNIYLSVILYFVGMHFFMSLNLVRQFVAMSILLIGYKGIIDNKKRFKYYLAQLSAVLIHSMSIIFVIVIFIKKHLIKPLYALLITIVLFLVSEVGIKFILKIIYDAGYYGIGKYCYYFNAYNGNFTWSAFIVEFIVYIYFCYILKQIKKDKKRIDKETVLFFNIQTLTLICTVLCYNVSLWQRVSLFFGFFQIMSIPHFYSLDKNKKLFIGKIKFKNIYLFTVIMLLLARMIFSIMIKGNLEVLPYKTIIERPKDIYSEINKKEVKNSSSFIKNKKEKNNKKIIPYEGECE